MEVLKSKRKDRVLMSVPPQNLKIKDGFNVRKDFGNLTELMVSIIESGLQIPIKAKKIDDENDLWEVVDGHRRLQAILLAIDHGHDIQYVDVMSFKGNEEDQVFSMLITGTGQKPLNEMEQAIAVDRLIHFGYKVDEIAKKMGRSLPHVYYLVKLASLPIQIKNHVQEGYISGLATMSIVDKYPEDEWQSKVEKAIAKANESSNDGEIKKATSKNLEDSEKKLKPIEKLALLVEKLNEVPIENKKCSLLNELWIRLMEDEQIDDLLNIFSQPD